ncbi:MAG: PQQ-binding-like beta-propeller repeat protein [Dehalococcoidia bacterium]
MKQSRRSMLALVLGAIALLGVACGGIQQPDGWAAPVGIGDRLLVQADTGRLSLIDPATGAAVWQFPQDHESSRPFYATPVLDGDALYLVDYQGLVTRLRTGGTTPQSEWVMDLGEHVVATPLLHAGSLYVATEEGRVHIINADDGTVARAVDTDVRRIWGSPAGGAGAVYIADLDNGVTLAIDTQTGERVWAQEISGPSAADLVLNRDLLVVGAFDHSIHALDVTANGDERWAFKGDGWFMGRPLIDGDTVYAATMRGTVYAIDLVSGEQRWAFTAPDEAEFRAAPLLVDGMLVAPARDGRVFALDAANGQQQWMQDVVSDGNVNADPYLDGTNIYLVTSRHDLVRVDVSGGGAFQSVPLAAAR